MTKMARKNKGWTTARRWSPLPALIVGLLASSGAHAIAERGRVTGKVQDSAGKPLTGLVLTFTPVDPALGEPRTVETNKKARFSDLRFPAGAWTVDPRVGEFFLESLTYTLLDKDGLARSTWGAKSHPRDGFPAVQVPDGATIRLDFTAADPVVGEKLDKGAAWARNAATIDEIGELFNAGKSQETLEAAENLLNEEPDLGPALYLKGAALNRLGRREEAIQHLRRARELMPEQVAMGGMLAEALLARALDLQTAGDSAGARPLADEAAGLMAAELTDASPFGTWWNHALALKTAGRTAALRTALEGLIVRYPGQPDPYQELAEQQFSAGQHDQALATLENMPPAGATNGAILLFNQALLLFDEKQNDPALKLLARAKTLDPGFVMALNLEAQILLAKGERGAAAAALKRFIELAPEGADTAGARRTLEALEPSAKQD